MVGTGVLERIKGNLPSFEEVKERATELSFEDLRRHRDLILYAVLLLSVVYTMHLLAVVPETTRVQNLEEKRERLKEEIQVLHDEGVQATAQALQVKVASLQQRVRDMAKEGDRIKTQWLPAQVAKGDFLRDISLLPSSFGWKVLTIEDISEDGEEAVGSKTTRFEITGEGTFEGLMNYLKRIEQSIAPAQVLGMEIERPQGRAQTLRSTLHVSVVSLQQDRVEQTED